MGLLGVGKIFQSKYKTTSGKTISGQFLSIPDTSRVTNFLSARRYFRTQPDTKLVPGDILMSDGDLFIVAEHGTGYYKTPIYKHFKMFQVDQQTAHTRKVVATNTVTGLKDKTSDQALGNVYLSIQPDRYIEDGTKLALDSHIAVCNKSDVQVNDLIGGYLVYKVDIMLGVSVLSLRQV